jgi:hypothetical protein
MWHTAPGAPGLTSVAGHLRLSPSMFFTYAEHNHALPQSRTYMPLPSHEDNFLAAGILVVPQRVSGSDPTRAHRGQPCCNQRNTDQY